MLSVCLWALVWNLYPVSWVALPASLWGVPLLLPLLTDGPSKVCPCEHLTQLSGSGVWAQSQAQLEGAGEGVGGALTSLEVKEEWAEGLTCPYGGACCGQGLGAGALQECGCPPKIGVRRGAPTPHEGGIGVHGLGARTWGGWDWGLSWEVRREPSSPLSS